VRGQVRERGLEHVWQARGLVVRRDDDGQIERRIVRQRRQLRGLLWLFAGTEALLRRMLDGHDGRPEYDGGVCLTGCQHRTTRDEKTGVGGQKALGERHLGLSSSAQRIPGLEEQG
jgi:hypothetical protein